MNKSFVTLTALFVATFFSITIQAEDIPTQTSVDGVKISVDAEYNGILIDAAKEVSIYYGGKLKSGYLKSDTTIDGVTYKAASLIRLFGDGKVWNGRIKTQIKIGGIPFKADTDISFFPSGKVSAGEVLSGAAPGDKNLILPIDLVASFSEDGSTISFVSTGEPYRILDFTVAVAVTVYFDEVAGLYRVKGGNNGVPKIVATLPVALDSFGRPSKVEVVIAPANSFLATQYGADESYAESWKITGRLTLNGQYLGYNPTLYIKDMAIVKFRVAEAVKINDVLIKAGTFLLFDSIGKVYIPQP